jgi:hypothetical protein
MYLGIAIGGILLGVFMVMLAFWRPRQSLRRPVSQVLTRPKPKPAPVDDDLGDDSENF